MKTKQFITSTLTLFTTTVLCFLLLKSTVAEAQTTSTATPVLVSQVTDYLLPEDFRVYVSPSGAIVNWPAPGYIEKILPTVNKYVLRDGGYIACYSRNQQGSIYSVGGGIYVMGQIRLQGRYSGRIFQPKGYEGKDISGAQEFKTLCNQTFPAALSSAWAGGDTGGWFGIQPTNSNPPGGCCGNRSLSLSISRTPICPDILCPL
ncbi:hypothetical protein [Nostoc sphaeroides]|uniref:Uncharacterized protein n=1 Tax=Nostoc sphaeroides CCNUC1 TaxID=2653204 RepID=A0A5P8WEW9_9NOSO|nr:hypothetical protein [Nostoc sphaeroides]QFS51375.1 hypothetical protein GXM_08869 [Nostoc sphaeroides CCNUC1]